MHMFGADNFVTALNLQNNTVEQITLGELYSKGFKEWPNYMVKDRYGWTHINDMGADSYYEGKIYQINIEDETFESIIIAGDGLIPVYDGQYREGFHGVAVYNYTKFPVTYMEYHDTAVNNGSVKDSTPKLLYCVKNQLFYRFNVTDNDTNNRYMIQIITNSGMCDINNISMITSLK